MLDLLDDTGPLDAYAELVDMYDEVLGAGSIPAIDDAFTDWEYPDSARYDDWYADHQDDALGEVACVDHAEAVVRTDAVRWALAELPAEFRAAVVLFDVEGMRYAQIAALQGVSVDTVKSRLCRGRRALRLLLDDGAS
jgi:RNA polymerase sigma factor (sigma-70 family)